MSTHASANQVTQLLARVQDGEDAALDALLSLLYGELRALAHRQRQRQGAPETLNTTALLHEAYLKLAKADGTYQDRVHFFRVAAKAMRHVLIDNAQRRTRAKRGGGAQAVSLDEHHLGLDHRAEEVLALDEALKRLGTLSPRQEQIVELRYFAGFTIDETARLVDLSAATVSREWTAARAWLQRELRS